MPETVETHSTDWDRTKMSALLVLAGLFPPSVSETWDDELHWQPIPYNFKSSADDHVSISNRQTIISLVLFFKYFYSSFKDQIFIAQDM